MLNCQAFRYAVVSKKIDSIKSPLSKNIIGLFFPELEMLTFVKQGRLSM